MDIAPDSEDVAATVIVDSPFKRLPLLGHYFQDGKYGDFSAQCFPWTSIYHCWARMQFSNYGDEPNSLWRARMVEGQERAVKLGKWIALGLNMQDPNDATGANIGIVIEKTAPRWDRVQFIDIADEPKWDRQTTKAMLRKVREIIAAEGLAPKPLGITYFTDRHGNEFNADVNDAIGIPPLDYRGQPKGPDFVGLECYCPAPGDPNAQVNNDLVKANVRAARGRLPDETKVVLVGQGFSRNGAWTNEATLVALQNVAFKLAAESARTLGLLYFSYGRPTGTYQHPKIEAKQREIAAKVGLA